MAGGETTRVRDVVTRYIHSYLDHTAMGLDLGYGGDAILKSAITLDTRQKYANFNDDPQHLVGDARNLYWFADGVLDYVYSSHLLEDFPPSETEDILREWVRVVRPGGLVILYLPNEKRYREYCQRHGTIPNGAHQNFDMSLEFMKPVLERVGLTFLDGAEESALGAEAGYSFLCIGLKPSAQ